MQVRAVIFDMDGLMVDTEPLYKRAWQGAAAELGCDLDDETYAAFVGRPTRDCERLLLERFGSRFPLADFRGRWPALWKEDVEAGVRTKPGLFELLDFVNAHRLPVAVATSSDTTFAGLTLQASGLALRFPVVVTGDTVARGKPAPDIYLETASRLGVAPAGCVAFEDSEAGIRAVADAGMAGVLVPEGVPSAAATAAARWVVPSLHEGRDVLARLISNGIPG